MFTDPLHVVCHNIRSLHNVGSIFRTADTAAVTKIHLCGYTGQPPRKEISKVSLGAEDVVEWEHHFQTWRVIEKLKDQHYTIVALENNVQYPSTQLPKLITKYPLGLLIGNEVSGLSDGLLKRADQIVSIPMYGTKESLNVAVALGIALYQLNQFRI